MIIEEYAILAQYTWYYQSYFYDMYVHLWCFYFYLYLKRGNFNITTNAYNNTQTVFYSYKKMLYQNKVNVSEGIDINKSNKSKECVICHYQYFLDLIDTYEPEVCNRCHDILMIPYELENIAILNVECKDRWLQMCYMEYYQK